MKPLMSFSCWISTSLNQSEKTLKFLLRITSCVALCNLMLFFFVDRSPVFFCSFLPSAYRPESSVLVGQRFHLHSQGDGDNFEFCFVFFFTVLLSYCHDSSTDIASKRSWELVTWQKHNTCVLHYGTCVDQYSNLFCRAEQDGVQLQVPMGRIFSCTAFPKLPH